MGTDFTLISHTVPDWLWKIIMTDQLTKTDVFPSSIHEPSAVGRLPRPSNFQGIVSNFEVIPFIIHLERDKIYYKKLEWDSRYQKHFYDTESYIRTLKTFEEKSWNWAARKLMKDVDNNLRRNIDTRTCFKYNHNYFIVKSCFTHGQRRVEPGTVHLYQIGAVQMVFYFVGKMYSQRITKRTRLFPADEQHWYSRRVLNANQCYLIPENTIYVVFAINKAFFSVHILKTNAQLPFECTNPIRENPKKPVDLIYRRPVQTPFIEDAVIGENEEEEDPPPSAAGVETVANELFSTSTTPSDPVSTPILEASCSSHRLDNEFMPPPPPPPPAPVSTTYQLITIETTPVEKTIQVVTPNVREWYQKHFKFQKVKSPIEDIVFGWSHQMEPMDLSKPVEPPITTATPIVLDIPPTPAVNEMTFQPPPTPTVNEMTYQPPPTPAVDEMTFEPLPTPAVNEMTFQPSPPTVNEMTFQPPPPAVDEMTYQPPLPAANEMTMFHTNSVASQFDLTELFNATVMHDINEQSVAELYSSLQRSYFDI